MTQKKRSMTADSASIRRTVLLVICAVVFPMCVLLLREYLRTDSLIRQDGLVRHLGSAAAPFGLSKVAIAYLFCCLPFSWWVVGYVKLAVPNASTKMIVVLSILTGIGFGLAALGINVDDSDSNKFDQSGWARNVTRVIWVFALQLPWMVAARFVFMEEPKSNKLATGLILAAIVFLAPLNFAESEIARQLQLYELHRKNGHLVDALTVAKNLNRLGTKPLRNISHLQNRTINDQVDRFLLLREEMPRLEIELEDMVTARINFLNQPLSSNPNYGELISRAQIYIAMGKTFYADAERILLSSGLSKNDSLGASMMGNIRYWQLDFSEAATNFQKTIDLEIAKPKPDKELVARALNNLADSLRAAEGNRSAEAMLKKAFDELPDYRAPLTYALGVHYQSAGRPIEALDQFEKLTETENELSAAARQRIMQIESESTGCFLWR